MARRIKVIYTGGPAALTRVVDAETGERIEGVQQVIWFTPPPSRMTRDHPRCVLVMAGVEVELAAEPELVAGR